ncbi:unnamed protein product [Rangifer tarandus platyrhynchus]|uniref:Uncharacterized protein n=1 Tax=Rangifer tarandus platyrhynchus TaxID=3082113 RepID=A0ABN8YEE2_RANTA|nr:unnamed protein product [Rangifer tarandus platyrhynchus]
MKPLMIRSSVASPPWWEVVYQQAEGWPKTSSEAPLDASLHAESLHGPRSGQPGSPAGSCPSPGRDRGPYIAFLFSHYRWPVRRASDKSRAAPTSSWSRATVSPSSPVIPKLGEEAHFTD